MHALDVRMTRYCAMVFLFACGSSGDAETPPTEEQPTSIQLRSVTYGTSLHQQRVTTPVIEFAPTDPVCISLEIQGRPRAGKVTLRWPLGSENVEAEMDLSDVNGGVVFSFGQSTYVGGTLTHTAPLPPGEYETIVLYEGTEVGRYPYRVVGTAGIAGPFVTAPTPTTQPETVNPFPSASSVIHAVWNHPNLPENEHITMSLIAVDVGTEAAPNTTVVATELDASRAGPMVGPLQFSLPRAWPVGKYRIVGVGNTLGEFATLEFTVE